MFTVEGVYHIMLDTDKATISDIISGHMLKATARSWRPSLTHIFHLLISLGTFAICKKNKGCSYSKIFR